MLSTPPTALFTVPLTRVGRSAGAAAAGELDVREHSGVSDRRAPAVLLDLRQPEPPEPPLVPVPLPVPDPPPVPVEPPTSPRYRRLPPPPELPPPPPPETAPGSSRAAGEGHDWRGSGPLLRARRAAEAGIDASARWRSAERPPATPRRPVPKPIAAATATGHGQAGPLRPMPRATIRRRHRCKSNPLPMTNPVAGVVYGLPRGSAK